jgi:sulfide:quinone oxidoreductase
MWRHVTSRHRSGTEARARRHAFGGMPAVCVMDAGRNGVTILADKMLPPR